MQWLAALCVRRPVFATVLVLFLVVIGIFGYLRLGVDRIPKVDFPTILVTTRNPGASPEEIEREITDRIEEAVNTISGLDELRSTSAEGVSIVTASFLLEKNVDVAAQEVRDRVNRVLPLLPRTVRQPTVEKMDPDAAPVLTLVLSSSRPIRETTEFADKVLRRQLESVDGVGQVTVLGGRKRQINIRLDGARLRAYQLTVTDVARALQQQNTDVPGGRVETGPLTVTLRTRGRVEAVADFERLVVRQRDGHPITVGAVGEVAAGGHAGVARRAVVLGRGRPGHEAFGDGGHLRLAVVIWRGEQAFGQGDAHLRVVGEGADQEGFVAHQIGDTVRPVELSYLMERQKLDRPAEGVADGQSQESAVISAAQIVVRHRRSLPAARRP
jgi:multidrug efflux pump subunit AcrB